MFALAPLLKDFYVNSLEFDWTRTRFGTVKINFLLAPNSHHLSVLVPSLISDPEPTLSNPASHHHHHHHQLSHPTKALSKPPIYLFTANLHNSPHTTRNNHNIIPYLTTHDQTNPTQTTLKEINLRCPNPDIPQAYMSNRPG